MSKMKGIKGLSLKIVKKLSCIVFAHLLLNNLSNAESVRSIELNFSNWKWLFGTSNCINCGAVA